MRILLNNIALSVVLLAACGDRDAAAGRPDEHPLISLHWPAGQPDPGVRICLLFDTDEEIALEPGPIIDVRHIADAYRVSDDRFVTVRLTEQGRQLLARATAERIGEHLAIVVDDRVVAMPRIVGSLDVDELPLMPMASTEAAEALAARIRHAIAER